MSEAEAKKGEDNITPNMDEVSEVVGKEDSGGMNEVIDKTKEEFLRSSGPLSYKEMQKMEGGFAKIFDNLSPKGVLETLKSNIPDIFKDVKNIEDALYILKNGKDGEDEKLELGKNENLYHWLKRNIKDEENKENEETVSKLKKQLSENNDISEQQKPAKEEKDHIDKTHKTKKHNKKIKSESKLWKTTKNVINRPLKHTWLGKYLIKKPIDSIKKMLKK